MPGPHKFYYGNSGAEAVECALKLARYHTGRQNVIAFFGAFHGRTMGALSLTASKPQQKRRFAPLVPGVTHIRYPYAYRGCSGGPQDEEAFALGCARYIEDKLFKTTSPPEEVAAIFVEPIQGEGGYVVAPDHLPAGAAPHLRPPRHPIGRRRSPVRRRPHRQMVGHRAHRRPARHRLHGQRHRLRHAARRLHEPRRDHGLEARLPRLHLRRQPGLPSPPPSPPWTCSSAKASTTPRASAKTCSTACAPGPERHPIVGDVRGRGLMIGIEIVENQATREVAAPAARSHRRPCLRARPAHPRLRRNQHPPRSPAHRP